jgi:hypothetical protein
MAEPEDGSNTETDEQYSPRTLESPPPPLGDCSVCGGVCVDHWAEEAMREESHH